MSEIKLKKLFAELFVGPMWVANSDQEKLLRYLLLLEKWNKTYNLTSIRDLKEMITHHILDSLSIRDYLAGIRILDVGTGAGLPGIPLAIVQPHREFYLLDSNQKKTTFLNQVLLELKISNVTIINARVEKYTDETCFDCIITRAFSSLQEFVDCTNHLVCKDGFWLAMKGKYPTEELANLTGEFSTMVYDLQVPGLNAERHLVKIQSILKDSHENFY